VPSCSELGDADEVVGVGVAEYDGYGSVEEGFFE